MTRTIALAFLLLAAAVPCRANPMDEAWNLLKEDQLERAIPPLQASLRKNPDHALLRYAMGVCLAHTGDMAGAAEHLKASADLDPSFAQTWYYLRTVSASGGPSEMNYFRKMADRNMKKNPHIHLNYGLLLLQDDHDKEAMSEFQRAARLGAAYAEAHFQIGAAHYDQGRWSDAVDSLRKAIGIDPDYAEAKRVLSLALAQTGEPQEEVETYRRQALELEPELSEREEVLRARAALRAKGKDRHLEERLDRLGKLYLSALKPLGLIMSPLVPFLENEPVGKTVDMATSSGPAAGWQVHRSTPRAKGVFSKIAIKWTSSKHLEPLPLEPLTDPDHFPLKLRLGGKRLFWAFFTTPNYMLSAQPAAPGRAAIAVRKIPPVQVRFDPDGTLIHQGDYAAGEEFSIGGDWDAQVTDVGSDTVSLRIKRRTAEGSR